MKRNRKLLLVAVAAILIIAALAVAVTATLSSERAMTIISAIINGDEYLESNDLNGDGKVNVLDAILAVRQDNFKGPKLTSLSFDDSDYSVNFDALTLSYTVNLPAGRPRIPKLVATAAEGVEIEYAQATIADSETAGSATVTVSDDSGSNTYSVKFVRAEADGAVVLQYDDRWTFTPDYTLGEGESFTFVSSDESVVSVDENGVLTAENVSDTPVTVKAMVGEEEKDVLTVTKIDKAQINLFLVTGQSNAHGCYDFDESSALNITKEDQIAAVELPETSGRVYSYDLYPRSENPEAVAVKKTLYDMAEVPRQGFASALGKTYYNLSGEKVVFYQFAYNGSPIERWLDTSIHSSLAETNNNYYMDGKDNFANFMATLPDTLFEINHRVNFWLQGETCMSKVWDYTNNTWKDPGPGETLFTDEDYANMFLKVHAQLVDVFGIESSNILLARAHGSVVVNADTNIKAAINNVRAAQYGLGNNYDDIAVVSRLSDYAVIGYNKYIGTAYEPYMGYMGVGNVHYNQIGHNANGRIAATNFFKSIDVDTNSVASSVEIINTDGIERLGSETVFEIEVGKTKRLAALALPEYSLENVTWSSSDEKVAKVNMFGLITVVGEGDAVITATAENGAKASVNVKGIESTATSVHYRWDFNGNLSSSADANDLRLSETATANGAASNYSFKDGAIVVSGSVAKQNRPDFTMEFPVVISSKNDWTIEWKADFYSNSVFLGQSCCNTTIAGVGRQINHIYSIHTSSNFSGGHAYPLRLVDSTATDHWLTYTADYQGYASSGRNAWKLEYKNSTGMISLYLNLNGAWTLVDSIEGGTFDAYFDTVLGRYNADGLVNFVGEFDYLDIKVGPAAVYEDVHYRWEFLDDPATSQDETLTSSYDENTLTMSPQSVAANATSYKIENGLYTTTTSGTTDNTRPVFSMAKPVVLTRDYDWSIEWRSQMKGGSGILGQEVSSQDRNFMYAAYSTAAYQFGLKIDDDNKGHVYLPYADNATDASNLNTQAMRSWKVDYVASTNTMSLKMYDDATGTWSTLSTYQPTTAEFTKVTYTALFGRYNADGMVNFRGTMDYMDIKTKVAVTKEYTEYDWQFNDYTSRGEDNDLTPTGTSGYNITDGVYSTTVSKADELALEKAITLDSSESWYIEWASDFVNGSNSLFGTENCAGKYNHIYLAASTYTNDFKSPVRILFDSTSATRSVDLQFVKDAENGTEPTKLVQAWNTWRLEYDKNTRTLSLQRLSSAKVWTVCDSVVMSKDFTMTLTHMFGDFNGANMVNMYGSVDYVKVWFVDKADN